jgi:hypothetical protein
MDAIDAKDTLRDAKTNTKEGVRELDGHQVKDDIGNAGDRLRDDLGKAGDKARDEFDKLHRDAHAAYDEKSNAGR